MFKYYNQKKRVSRSAHEIYGSIVAQTRMPIFYADWRVPDTVEGRFEVLVLHMALVICRLNEGTQDGSRELGRKVAEAFIDDLDGSFREMGVGDLAVPKRMKTASEAYYGRLRAYGGSLGEVSGAGLADALKRNILSDEELRSVNVAAIADYMLRSSHVLAEIEIEEINNGHVEFANFHREGNDMRLAGGDGDEQI